MSGKRRGGRGCEGKGQETERGREREQVAEGRERKRKRREGKERGEKSNPFVCLSDGNLDRIRLCGAHTVDSLPASMSFSTHRVTSGTCDWYEEGLSCSARMGLDVSIHASWVLSC